MADDDLLGLEMDLLSSPQYSVQIAWKQTKKDLAQMPNRLYYAIAYNPQSEFPDCLARGFCLHTDLLSNNLRCIFINI